MGRCANWVLRGEKRVFSVFVTANREDAIGRVSTVENLSDEAAARRIDQVNQGRSNHYHQYTGAHWTDARDYDLVVNTSSVGLEQAANIILQCVKDKMKTNGSLGEEEEKEEGKERKGKKRKQEKRRERKRIRKERRKKKRKKGEKYPHGNYSW